MTECMIVGIGGFIGAVCRYLIGLIPLKEGCVFPIKTFLINAAGCFLIGMIAAFAMKANWLDPKVVLFLKVGICGGFTTFSSFALETEGLIRDGRMNTAVLYAVLSVVAGVIAVYAGQEIIRSKYL